MKMEKNLSKIFLVIEISLSLIILGAIFIWAPVCDGLLKLENGNMVHMKCFYTGQASVILSVLLLASAIAAYMSKNDHKKVHFIVALIGIMLFANTFTSSIGIGICKMDTMACHTTASWIRIGGILAVLTSFSDILFNKSNQ